VLPFFLGKLDSENEREAVSAVEALAALDGERRVTGLAKALASPRDRVRYQALRALAGESHPGLTAALVALLEDPRRVHRLLALRMLADLASSPARRGIVQALGMEEFLDRDREEQATWLRALVDFPDQERLPVFAGLLGQRSAARKAIAQLQLLVVEQLSVPDQPQARQLLAEHKGRWQLARAVRKAIAATLAGGAAP
jgi:HEAT repeat protein